MAEAGRGGKSGKSKHIDVRYFFVKQHIDHGDRLIQHLPTADMTADRLTKPLLGHQCYILRAKLMTHPAKMFIGAQANVTLFHSKEYVACRGSTTEKSETFPRYRRE
jgi:hypothetical protein